MDPKNNNNKNKNNKNGKGNKNLKGVLILVVWALALTVAINYFSAYMGNTANKSTSHEIPYSDLWTLVEQDKIDSVSFESGTVYATPVDGYTYTDEDGKAFTHSEEKKVLLYTTDLNDDDLFALLREHGVEYTEPYQAPMSPILEFMIAYLLPIIVMVGVFMLLMRVLSKGGGMGGIGNVGKSNAKVYMEKSTGVTFKDVAGQDEA